MISNLFMRKLILLSLTVFLSGLLHAHTFDEPFWNQQLPVDVRVRDLVSRLTTDEKTGLLVETSPGVPRLEVPKYLMGNEALHGVVRPGKFTVFPQAIGLAAMWNPDLLYRITDAISDEARGRWNELQHGKFQHDLYSDLLVFWSPDLNLARDPRWGRTQETYGEDPFLASRLGVAFVKGLQGNDPDYLKVVATPKHYTANNEEHNRFECNAREYRTRGIPLDNMVQDWNYWPDYTWGPEWDRVRYPDPRKMCRDLKEMNLQLMVSVWPRVDNPKLEDRYHLEKNNRYRRFLSR